MMFVTFQEYTDFGYDTIPEDVFPRTIYKAGLVVEANTLTRVTIEFLRDPDSDPSLVERNKRGICEIADLIYQQDTRVMGEAGVAITGFRNEGYSETFANRADATSVDLFNDQVSSILATFFTVEQLSRRM